MSFDRDKHGQWHMNEADAKRANERIDSAAFQAHKQTAANSRKIIELAKIQAEIGQAQANELEKQAQEAEKQTALLKDKLEFDRHIQFLEGESTENKWAYIYPRIESLLFNQINSDFRNKIRSTWESKETGLKEMKEEDEKRRWMEERRIPRMKALADKNKTNEDDSYTRNDKYLEFELECLEFELEREYDEFQDAKYDDEDRLRDIDVYNPSTNREIDKKRKDLIDHRSELESIERGILSIFQKGKIEKIKKAALECEMIIADFEQRCALVYKPKVPMSDSEILSFINGETWVLTQEEVIAIVKRTIGFWQSNLPKRCHIDTGETGFNALWADQISAIISKCLKTIKDSPRTYMV